MKKPYIIATALLALSALIVWNQKVKQRGQQESEKFYSATINSRITYLSANVGAVYFKVADSEVKYGLIPTATSGKAEERFSAFAAVGDSISKPANTAILKLYKNNQEYKYRAKILHEQPQQSEK